MSHLADPNLRHWKSGEQLSAEALNWNFAVLVGLIETAAALACQPDRDAQRALERVAALERRMGLLEAHEAASERERGLRQYTPLAAHGLLAHQMMQLAGPLRHAAAALEAEHGNQRAELDRITTRLAALEDTPEAAELATVVALQAQLRTAQEAAQAAEAKAARLEAELAALRQLVTAPDRDANRRQYASLGAFGQLLGRVAALEERPT